MQIPIIFQHKITTQYIIMYHFYIGIQQLWKMHTIACKCIKCIQAETLVLQPEQSESMVKFHIINWAHLWNNWILILSATTTESHNNASKFTHMHIPIIYQYTIATKYNIMYHFYIGMPQLWKLHTSEYKCIECIQGEKLVLQPQQSESMVKFHIMHQAHL